jgi:hypothetical protein
MSSSPSLAPITKIKTVGDTSDRIYRNPLDQKILFRAMFTPGDHGLTFTRTKLIFIKDLNQTVRD